MRKVVVFGAAGHTGKYITEKMKGEQDIELSVFVRNLAKFEGMDMSGVKIIKGDALNADDVKKAMEGQDVLLCSLEGDVLKMAQNIVSALDETSVKRIIWITGMGIHHEITGMRGVMLNMLAKKRPDYIEAADTIAASKADTTLLRCPGIKNGHNTKYFLTKEGEQPAHKDIERAGIAQCMLDMIRDEQLGVNESLGITN
ncbi:NAD(P)H-binding protein [Eubacterium sp. MSJ-13]|uniref:NAD(P)H-binding protein n=1 Tax=Eubacterium sp. MSJ-13 TaxID=2841513 RepID=UPI001C0FCAD6|nr:NAD(P)H-binding protein [Eubacterium sp. MSJ-13]MBU5478388.1 NAD(P)H-binding protein [Eubacterium sp. MSJ-13]